MKRRCQRNGQLHVQLVSPYLVHQPAKALAVLNGQAANSMKNETTRCAWAVNNNIMLKYVTIII